jgi:HK97 family phage prohead protease
VSVPYFISNEQADCAGWATIKIDDDGSIETIGCHETMNEAVAQMVAVSLDEGIEPGGEYEGNSATRQEDIPTMKRGQLSNVREVRHYGISDIEVREEGDAGTVTFSGYASVFNHDYEVYDAFGRFTERLAPGAFTRTLTEDPDVMLLINHQGLPLARTKSGTLRLTQDSVGLRVSAQLDANDPDVRAILPKMRRGDVDEMSFAFRVNDQVWSEDYTDRTITEVNLARGDVSIVSFGANPATVAALRAALADEDVRAQLLGELGEERILTTSDLEEPADDEAVETPAEDVADEVVEDEARGCQGSVASLSYYVDRLVEAARPD